jgi:hypothetical protein
MSRVRGQQEFKDEDGVKVDEKNETTNQTKLDKIDLSSSVKTFEFNMNTVDFGKVQLENIAKKGVIKSFLKLIFFSQYIPFNTGITELEGKLFEYPINELEITQFKLILTSNLLVLEPKNFLVKSIGVFLIDSDFLMKKEYKEILLALYMQEQDIALQNSNRIDLRLTINLAKEV